MELNPLQLSIIGSIIDSFAFAVLAIAAKAELQNEQTPGKKSSLNPTQLNIFGNRAVLLGDTILAVSAELSAGAGQKDNQNRSGRQHLTRAQQERQKNNADLSAKADANNILSAWISVVSDLLGLQAAELKAQATQNQG